MLFWVLAALLTLIASLAVMLPFLRRRGDRSLGVEHDLAVYRDQLAELEQEVGRGLISKADAAEARAEIGRRILRLRGAGKADSGGAGGRSARAIAAAAVLAVPLVSWGLYAFLGSPGMPALPLQARLTIDPSQASLDELVARAEAHLADNPQDARGWEVLAPIYARLGRYGDAAAAYRRTIALTGPSAAREAALGEALVGEAGGIVTAEAEAGFERALEIDAANPRARFFIAMARAQEGNTAEARAMWEEMAAGLPQDSPWKEVAGQAIAGLTGSGGEVPEEPSEADITAAEEMTPEARQEMVEGMVARLDARLREDPADIEAWRRLLRSYVVLGRRDEAGEALERALAAFGADSKEAETLTEYAETLGVPQGE
ncbi:c-type cytochrome biogenesis protein CcmI [Chelativorans salis]|uniref:C-type cytochrome biogenesis protein CcmI n=1 Tax=Chelativorans salis TaxID=2978478 RepID=A0ABT2LNM8_9HYPH|nr:c-type cytochrome biogenesis protein CcmI [Chelativorans sp. EGI FJ00035]MCT7376052.1 c-type cytochrome biogenesis protein CcmI [Chelativorans sp. EGI FJ00035]